MNLGRKLLIAALCVGTMPGFCRAEEDDDEVPTYPGLIARLTSAGQAVERKSETIAFDWQASAPDPRLSPGPFLANWSGVLLARPTSKYQFHAYLQGDLSVTIDGALVLGDERKTPGWVTGAPVALESGERRIEVAYRSRPGKATLRLFWSSEAFPLEPIPAQAFAHLERRADLNLVEKGRRDFVGHRCNRCHRRPHEPLSPPAASLTRIAGVLPPDYIAEKVEKGMVHGVRGKMPKFGFTRDEAQSITAFLLQNAEPPELEELPKLKPADDAVQARIGSTLFRSVGCVACHPVPRDPSTDQGEVRPALRPDGSAFDRFERQPFTGGDLTQVGLKRSVRWLFTWLGDPAKLNASHQMPVFRLSPVERAQLALFLAGKASPPVDRTQLFLQTEAVPDEVLQSRERAAAGKKLIQDARCNACHLIEDIEPSAPALSKLAEFNPDWRKACVNIPPDRETFRPAFPDGIMNNVRVYLVRMQGELSPLSADLQGLELLEQNNCLGCHDRGPAKGVSSLAAEMSKDDDALRGQSVALIPPTLTAVGDRLKDAALRDAVVGEIPKPRLPWLKVRMPRFRHTDSERDLLARYLIDQDRIPSSPPAAARLSSASSETPERKLSAEALLIGQQFVGPAGFSCIACHEIGSYKPKNVALGTRGSDLLAMTGRMRKEYFLRWTRAPARIVPGMEMPSYQKPVAGLLGDSIDAQLMAIWDAVHDPRFTVPTNPSAVEQYFTVDSDAPARIVRDVFTNPPEYGPPFVPRSFAIGLNSGHNLLLDLDTFTLRQWTFGDFARQRAEGKSWYWDLAGVPVMRGAFPKAEPTSRPADADVVETSLRLALHAGSDWEFQRRGAGSNGISVSSPLPGESRLVDYERRGDGVRLRYRLAFADPASENDRLAVEITETVMPFLTGASADPRSGFRRRFQANRLPDGAELRLVTLHSENAFGNGKVAILGATGRWIDANRDSSQPDGAFRRRARFVPSEQGVSSLELEYSVALAPRRVTIPEKPRAQADSQLVITTPGYEGTRLPIDGAVMPTSIAWTSKGRLAFSSLKGHVFLADDSNGDGLEDTLTTFEEGLAAPYGVIADGDDLLVAHKPEILRLIDADGDGRADARKVFATGWGYTDNYHDWTCGFARDAAGNLFVGLGSDYAQPERRAAVSRWRGKVLKIDASGAITPTAHALRYPTGLAFDAEGRLFATDNQGVQNTFNELNHIVEGRNYGVPARYEEDPKAPETPPAIQIPHPWTRSVNGIAFLPRIKPSSSDVRLPADHPSIAYAGHGIGCEYDSRFLVRFTLQQVGDQTQGAVYPFSQPEQGAGGRNFTGPLSIATAPNGDIYIGSIHDSGWLGGLNTGDITRLRPKGTLPNGIRELRATTEGFEIEFLRPLTGDKVNEAERYSLSAYTRKWQGAYATPDSGRHRVPVEAATWSSDRRTVRLKTGAMKEGFVYEFDVGGIADDPLWPSTASYTLHRRPGQ